MTATTEPTPTTAQSKPVAERGSWCWGKNSPSLIAQFVRNIETHHAFAQFIRSPETTPESVAHLASDVFKQDSVRMSLELLADLLGYVRVYRQLHGGQPLAVEQLLPAVEAALASELK